MNTAYHVVSCLSSKEPLTCPGTRGRCSLNVCVCVCILIAGRYESAVAAVMTRLDGHLPGLDVTADVTEFTFKQLLHDSAQPRDGLFLFAIYYGRPA